MEPLSMTSTFIAAWRREVKAAAVEKLEVEAAEAVARTGLPPRKMSRMGKRRSGDPGKTRTSDTQFRKLLLYPPELRGHCLQLILSK